MPPFDDKREFTDGDPEDAPRPLPLIPESPDDDMEDLATDESEDEFADVSDEMKEFTVEDWRGEFPDYDVTELEEKILERPRRWMAPVASCLMGTLLAAAFAGLLMNRVPRPRQVSRFFVFLLVLAPLVSFAWHWFFILRPNRVMKKLSDEETNQADAQPIHPE